MRKEISRIILYILITLIVAAVGAWLINPVYSEDEIYYYEGECVSYRWVDNIFITKYRHKDDVYITLSDGEEYAIIESDDVFEVSPELVGSAVKVGAVDGHTINGGRKTAYLSVDGTLIYDNSYLVKRHLQSFGALLIPCALFATLAMLPHIITIVEETKKKRERARRKKKHHLKMEQRKRDSENAKTDK